MKVWQKALVLIIVCLTASIFCRPDAIAVSGISGGEIGSNVYTILIPARISFSDYNQAQTFTVKASDLKLKSNEELVVTMTSMNGALKSGNSTIPYNVAFSSQSMTVDETIISGKSYRVLRAIQNNGSEVTTDIVFTSGDSTQVIYSGKHSDWLTFNVSLKENTV